MVTEKEQNGDKYVTYKHLMISTGSMFGIILVVFGLYLSHAEKKVDIKVYEAEKSASSERYATLCGDVDNIKTTVQQNAEVITLIGQNQELVLRKLGIEPVRVRQPKHPK